VLAPTVKQVTLHEPLASFASQAEDENYTWPLSSFAPGVLTRFDLPDCHAWLKAHKRVTG